VAAKPDLYQNRGHIRPAQHREVRLLHATIRTRMHVDQALLNGLSEIARLAQMLILRHVGDDEAERVALWRVGPSLELHRFVFHILYASLVLRLRLGQEICLESVLARAGGGVASGRIAMDRDENVAMIAVRDPTSI